MCENYIFLFHFFSFRFRFEIQNKTKKSYFLFLTFSGKLKNFEKKTFDTTSADFDYDYNSIMHYGPLFFRYSEAIFNFQSLLLCLSHSLTMLYICYSSTSKATRKIIRVSLGTCGGIELRLGRHYRHRHGDDEVSLLYQ